MGSVGSEAVESAPMWSGQGATGTSRRWNRVGRSSGPDRGGHVGRPAGRGGPVVGVLTLVALVLVTVGIGVRPAAAQPPSGLFGLWTHDPADPPPEGADVIAVYPAEGGTVQVLRVALQFAGPFTPADNGYRASVVIGDPGAVDGQLRVSYRTVDGGSVGTLERSEGEGWTDLGLSTIDGTAGDGLIVFEIPTQELGAPSSLWVDIEVPRGGAATAPFVSDYLPLAAFAPVGASGKASGQASGGALPRSRSTSAWGQVETLDTTTAFPLQPALQPPSLSVANRGLLISTELPAPTAVDGSQVDGVVDRIHLVAADLSGPSPGYIQIDRVSGSVDLYAVGSGAPVAVTSRDPWLGTAPEPGDPGAPVVVTADLPTVAGLLGLPEDASQLAVSADRTITLADERTVVAVEMGATVEAISEATAAEDAAATVPDEVVAPSPSTSDEGVQVGIVLIVGGIAVLVVLGVVLHLFGPGRRSAGTTPRASGSSPRPPRAPARAPAPARKRSGGTAPSRRSPDAALAALEQQFSELGIEIPPPGSNGTAAPAPEPTDGPETDR